MKKPPLTYATTLGLTGLGALGFAQYYGGVGTTVFAPLPLAAAVSLVLLGAAMLARGATAVVLGALAVGSAIGADVLAFVGLSRLLPELRALELPYSAAFCLALLGVMSILQGAMGHASAGVVRGLLILVAIFGIASMLGPAMRMHILVSKYHIYGMNALTGAGVAIGAIALWLRQATAVVESEHRAEQKIPLFTAAILLILAIGAGLAGFSLMAATTERVLTDNLRVSLEHRLRTFETALDQATETALLAASRPRFNMLLARRAHGVLTTPEHAELQHILDDILKNTTISALMLYDTHGQRIAERGILANDSYFLAPLKSPHQLAMLWDDRVVLRARLPLKSKDEHIATMVVDVPMRTVDRMFTDFAGLGVRGTMGICMPLDTQLRCLPSRANGYRVITSDTFFRGEPVPMHYALRGSAGIMAATDIHGERVMAAYAPIGRHPLGMLVKTDIEGLYQPIRGQLVYLAIALCILVVIGMVLLRWLITPLARKLAVEVRERKLAQQRLTHLAHHDSLTGLPNRVLLHDRLQLAMIGAQHTQRLVAVMLLDLDRFKNVNDTLGHGIGDLLLKDVAQRLLKCVRAGDIVSRLGGDEFALVLPGVTHSDHISHVTQRILKRLSEPFAIESHTVSVSASLGVTMYPHDDETLEGLLKNADTAMYRAKEAGRNTCQFYSAEMHAKANKRLAMENRLRGAVDRGELLLHYQPLVDLHSGEMIGMEALLRWQDPEFGLVSPLEFIPLAEEIGLIVPIGEWVLRTACAQTRAWHTAGLVPLGRVSVNLSARQFHKGLAGQIANILTQTQLRPSALVLELTESSLMLETDIVRETLSAIDEMGVQIALDDFGTGYSSLSYLKRFPIDVLKIDRSFVHGIPTHSDDTVITTAIISMAHSLGIKVIAEGVETADQLAFLRTHGCDAMQGYYFSKPLSTEQFAELLRRRRRLADVQQATG